MSKTIFSDEPTKGTSIFENRKSQITLFKQEKSLTSSHNQYLSNYIEENIDKFKVKGDKGEDGEVKVIKETIPFTFEDFSNHFDNLGEQQLKKLMGKPGVDGKTIIETIVQDSTNLKEDNDKLTFETFSEYFDRLEGDQLEKIKGPEGKKGQRGLKGKSGGAGSPGEKGDKGDSGGTSNIDLQDVTVESSVAVNDLVYLDTDTVYKQAKADDINTSQVIGFVVSKSDSTTATIRKYGTIDGLSGLTVAAIYYLSDTTAGGLTSTSVTTSTNVRIGVGIAISATEMLIDINLAPGIVIRS